MITYKYAADEVWGVFQEFQNSLLTKLILIAENPEIDAQIYVTAEKHNGKTLPAIVFYLDDIEFCSEITFNEWDCEHTVLKAYANYLDPMKVMDMLETEYPDDDEGVSAEQIDLIEAREDVLGDATILFLDEVADGSLDRVIKDPKQADEIREDFLNHACEYLYKKWHIQIYRPMVLEDKDGEEFFEEYPYDSMIFEDEEPAKAQK